MKKIIFFVIVFFAVGAVFAQKKKTEVQPTQAEMNKMLEDAMKAEGMSKEEQEEMKKMMGEIMPDLMEQNAQTADYPSFSDNTELVPPKNEAAIAKATGKKIIQAEMASYASSLYNKIAAKGTSAEIALAKKIIAATPHAALMNESAVLCMLQGHNEAALALALKAVQTDASNLLYQNNMAALLTQYGFAELAIPVLNKLRLQQPGNSTLLNNLAFAWLSLGETEKARVFANGAALVNPAHPEARACGGIANEVRGGDPIKEYTDALENSVNPFTEKLIENKGGNAKPDWNRIKRNLSIHEYFPKDWMQLPKPLSNEVKQHYEDQAMKRAYLDMTEKLREKIGLMTEELQKDLDDLTDKGEEAFVKAMAKETMKGLSVISKPAASIMKVLLAYQVDAQSALADSLEKIGAWKEKLAAQKNAEIKRIYQQIDNSKGTTCEQVKTRLDELENVYMRTVNNRLRNLLVKNVDEYREWTNAFITWNWFVAGNIKNYITIQNLQQTAYLAEQYSLIVTEMETFPEHCGSKTPDIVRTIPEPEIPNFNCPAVVHLPSGKEWQRLSNESKNFDKNSSKITKQPSPVPNLTVAYGTGGIIAQPGYAPFIKTADGSVTPGGFNGNDELTPLPNLGKDDLTPLPNIKDELAPLPNLPKDDELVPLPDLRKSQLAKELLKNMFANSCDKQKKKKVKFVVEPDFSKLRIWDEGTPIPVEEDYFVVGIGELIMDPLPTPAKDKFTVGIGQLTMEPITGATPEGRKILQEVKQAVDAGLQSTINNGLQLPGTTSMSKDIFR
ncbi:MAG TPA: tetratricopeptide repeat protein [Flavitalea sp.]|nr:tetratricopeptide repeat protein [Flavitalea sp.]